MAHDKQTVLNWFTSKLAKREGKKASISIGNVRELTRIADEELDGKLYELIEKKYEEAHK